MEIIAAKRVLWEVGGLIGYLVGLALRRNGRISTGRDVGKRIPDEGTS